MEVSLRWAGLSLGTSKPREYSKDKSIMATFAFHYFPGGLLLLFYQASAFPAAESPPSSDNDSVLAVSELPTKPKYNYAAGSGRDRDRHCKQTRQWQDVTQIYLEGHNGKDALLVHLQLGGGGGCHHLVKGSSRTSH